MFALLAGQEGPCPKVGKGGKTIDLGFLALILIGYLKMIYSNDQRFILMLNLVSILLKNRPHLGEYKPRCFYLYAVFRDPSIIRNTYFQSKIHSIG